MGNDLIFSKKKLGQFSKALEDEQLVFRAKIERLDEQARWLQLPA